MSLKNNCYLSVYGVFRSDFKISNLTSMLTAETGSSLFCVSCLMLIIERNTEKDDQFFTKCLCVLLVQQMNAEMKDTWF